MTSFLAYWTLNSPDAATERKDFLKEALLCAFIVMKNEGFSEISDLMDYLESNLIIAHYYGFNIMKSLPSYWTYDRFLNRIENGGFKEVMTGLVKELYERGIVDASFISLDSTLVMANTAHNNLKSFKKDKFSKGNHPSSDPDCALGVYSASTQHNEKKHEFYWGYKSHVLVDCISGLHLYELTTPTNVADSTVTEPILKDASRTLTLEECTFLADKAYDVKSIYELVRNVYNGKTVIPLNKRNTKDQRRLPLGNPICESDLAMSKNGKTSGSNGGLRQKFCCPFRNSRLNTIAHIAILAVAYAAVVTKSHHSYRSLKLLRRVG